MSNRACLPTLLLALAGTVLPGDLSAQPVSSPARAETGTTPERRPAGSTPPPLALKGVLAPQMVVPLLTRDLPEALKDFHRAANRLEAASRALQSAYQAFIRDVAALDTTAEPVESCGNERVAAAYADLQHAWRAYRKQIRLLTDCYRGIDAFHSGEYGQIVTPNLQADLEAAVQTYDRVAREHLAWRALMRKQVSFDAERLNCPYLEVPSVPETLPVAERPPAFDDMVPPASEDVRNAGGAPTPETDRPDEQPAAPSTVTVSPAPAQDARDGAQHRDDTSLSSPEVPPAPVLQTSPTPVPVDTAVPPPSPSGAAIRFAVDNSECDHGVVVYLDGRHLGEVPARMSAEFEATDGAHALCAAPVTDTSACTAPNAGVETILYDGFALRPGC